MYRWAIGCVAGITKTGSDNRRSKKCPRLALILKSSCGAALGRADLSDRVPQPGRLVEFAEVFAIRKTLEATHLGASCRFPDVRRMAPL